jgi:hypothetical protein
VDVKKLSMPLFSSPSPQRILEADAAVSVAVVENGVNHWPNDEPMIGPVLSGQLGSSMHKQC